MMSDPEEKFIQDLMVISRNLKSLSMDMLSIIESVNEAICKYELYKYDKNLKRKLLIDKVFS